MNNVHVVLQFAIGILLLAIAVVVIRFKFAYGLRKSPPRSTDEPRYLSPMLGILAILLGLVLILVLTFPDLFPNNSLFVPLSLRFVGVATGWLGLAIMYWSLRALGPSFSGSSGAHPDAQLCNTGPYRYIRHPYYTATLLLTTGLAVALSSWILLLGGTLLFASLCVRSRAEERELSRQFPDAYRALQQRTGRFLPKLF